MEEKEKNHLKLSIQYLITVSIFGTKLFFLEGSHIQMDNHFIFVQLTCFYLGMC